MLLPDETHSSKANVSIPTEGRNTHSQEPQEREKSALRERESERRELYIYEEHTHTLPLPIHTPSPPHPHTSLFFSLVICVFTVTPLFPPEDTHGTSDLRQGHFVQRHYPHTHIVVYLFTPHIHLIVNTKYMRNGKLATHT